MGEAYEPNAIAPTEPAKIDSAGVGRDEVANVGAVVTCRCSWIPVTDESGKTVRGNISQDKDVDVYQFAGKSGEKIRAEIIASRAGSLMDGLLMLYNAQGVLLAQEDDSATSRDPEVNFTLPADGIYFLVVSDSHDRGGEWRSYELTLQVMP